MILIRFVSGSSVTVVRSCGGMSTFLATDDANQGALLARCGPREVFYLLAPDSCSQVPNTVPPEFTFSRSHYAWLSWCLLATDDSDETIAAMNQFTYGTHTLTWAAMHHIVAQAVNAGFSVPNPTDILRAVKSALDWARECFASTVAK